MSFENFKFLLFQFSYFHCRYLAYSSTNIVHPVSVAHRLIHASNQLQKFLMCLFERYIWPTLPPKESVRLLRPVHTFILNKNNTVFSYNAFIIVNSKFVWERICLTWTTHSLGRPTKLRLFQNSVQYYLRIEQLDFPCPKNHWRWYIIRTSIRL